MNAGRLRVGEIVAGVAAAALLV
ncbi:MAG: hypothetical protein JWP18_1163, partial [Solirubrobacterales bacterium]|nr:hypothetical protein [Solirubrobacterales bacterium]